MGYPASAQDALEGLEIIGKPVSRGVNMQPASTSVATDLQWLDGMVLWIIAVISIFVTLLLFVIVRYNRKANPEPALTIKVTGNQWFWT